MGKKTGDLIHSVGTTVLCARGHDVCDVIKDITIGDQKLTDKLGNWRDKQIIPVKGDPFPLRCWCGEIYYTEMLTRFEWTHQP